MADQRYYNMNSKGEDNRYKVNTNILRMMQANPALGTGYIIGSMLGENYWGKKRAKSEREADARGRNGSVGADANGTYGTAKEPNYYSSMNKALDEYKNNPNGKVLYSGSGDNSSNSNPGVYIDTAKGIYPQTPQQANKPAVTTENAGSGGGVPGVMDYWNNMNNASMYNAGNTAMYTNGARNLGNVIGADANGVYGVNSTPVIGANENGLIGVPNGGSAPSAANIPRSPQTVAPNPNPAPIPYTPEQIQQIRDYGGFTDEELRRAGAEAAIPQTAPTQASAPSGGGYTASDEATPVAPANPAPSGDEMRLIKGDAPAPEVYDYSPGYTSPQDMDNLAWDRGNYNALARAKENLGVFGQALARIPQFFNGQQKARDRWNNRK